MFLLEMFLYIFLYFLFGRKFFLFAKKISIFIPLFHIEGIVAKAETMVITLDDLGHPLEAGYNHWIAWNITPAECIPGGIAKGSVVERPIHIEQGMLMENTVIEDQSPRST